MNALERVQKKFTRMVPGMRNFSYEDRLERLGEKKAKRRFNRDVQNHKGAEQSR